MVIPSAVAYGVLFSVALLVLAACAFVFWWRERVPKHTDKHRPPPPIAWPISPEASAALTPVKPRAAASRPDRSEAHRPT